MRVFVLPPPQPRVEGVALSYSLDLRTWVVAATQRGMTAPQAAVFQISVATIERWRRRARETGDLMPRTSPGQPRVILVEQEAHLRVQLQTHPDATLAEHCRQWRNRYGVAASPATMCRTLQRLGWTRKTPTGHPA
jgi:transposase